MFTVGNNDGDCSIVIGLENDSIIYYDFEGNEYEEVPNLEFDDLEYQAKWDLFVSDIKSVPNIMDVLNSLEIGEGVQIENLIFYLD